MKTFAHLAVLACVMYGASPAQAQMPPVLDYVGYPDFNSALLSPDGKHIALVVSRDDTDLLQIVDTSSLQLTASFETQENTGILQYWWANEERIVFATSTSPGDRDQPYMTGNLYGLNVDNSQKFLLVGPSNGDSSAFMVLDTLKNDRNHVVVLGWPIRRGSIARSHPIAYRLNIYRAPRGHANTRLSDERLSTIIGSPLGWGAMATDNDGTVRLAYAVNDTGMLDVKVRDANGGDWVDVASFLGAEVDGLNTGLGTPLGFNSANDGIYHLTHSPYGTVGVGLFDIASEQSTLLYAHERYDVGSGDLIWSADGSSLLGVTVMGALPETHYFSDHSDVSFHRSLNRALPDQRIDFQNFTDDQRKGLAMVSSPTMPPALFMLDRDKGEFMPLFSSMSQLQTSPMTNVEPLSLLARDGTTVEAYLTPGISAGEDPAPLLVLVHGGPHGIRDNPVFDAEVKLLASRGYSVLQVNYRGSGGYGLAFQESGYRNWGTLMIDDVVDATRYVVEQGKAQAERICIMGGSYGAYAAMMALARYPDMWKCGVGISGVYDLTYMRKSDIPFLPGGEAFLEQVLGSDTAALQASSPVTLAAAIKAPVFLAHGGDDRRAPVQHANRLKDALDDANVDYEWYYVRNAGHGFARADNRERLYTELLEFLTAKLQHP